MCRERLDLNFGWRFSADFRPEYIRPDFKDTAFRLVDLPHTVAEWRDDVCDTDCRRVTCYRKMFLLPETMKGRRLVLHFEGVMGCTAAFVNGRSVCAHKGGYTPFECDITEVIGENVRNEEILIAVIVDSNEREDTAPYGGGGILHDGGIYREVWLEATDKEFIEEYQMTTGLEKEQWFIDVSGRLSVPQRREVKINLYDGDRKLGAKVIFAENGQFSTHWQPSLKLEPWSPGTPKLYRVEIAVEDGDSTISELGFRQAEFRTDGFYLNGERVMLVGFTRNQIYSRAGAAASRSMQWDDAAMLRRLGCNFVRTGGYPPSRSFLDACDGLGIMVMDEVPGCGFVGNDEWQECLLDNLRELVLRDRSRTCVIMWSGRVPYTPEDSALAQRILTEIKKLDPTRAVGGVRAAGGQTAIAEDVYCFDDCTGADNGLEKKKNVYKPKAPYLIAGHSGGRIQASRTDDNALLLEQALAHAKALNTACGDPEIIGFCGGDLSDYPVHSTDGYPGGVCRSGVADCSRITKPAACVYRSQREDEDFLEIIPGTVSGTFYAFTNCEKIRVKRDGKSIAEYLPARKQYAHLPHPPIVIDDIIGDQPCVEDGIEQKELAGFRTLIASMRKDMHLPQDARIKSAATAAARYKISGEELVRLCDKYCAIQNGTAPLTFEGLKKGRPVCIRVICAADESAALRISCDRSELISEAAYDCIRVELTAVDGSGNVITSRCDAVSAEVDGSIEVVGSRLFALKAGSAVFYVRSKGGKGPARVKLSTEALGNHTIDFEVVRTRK